MVGLPARGKSYLTNKLCRYLNWLQYDARIFNVGNTRRKASKTAGPASVPLPDNGPHTSVWNQHEPKQSLHQTTLRGPGGYTGDLHMPSEEEKESQDQSSEATDSSLDQYGLANCLSTNPAIWLTIIYKGGKVFYL